MCVYYIINININTVKFDKDYFSYIHVLSMFLFYLFTYSCLLEILKWAFLES